MRLLEQARQFAVAVAMNFAVDQQRQAFFETHRRHTRLRKLFFQAPRGALTWLIARRSVAPMTHGGVMPALANSVIAVFACKAARRRR